MSVGSGVPDKSFASGENAIGDCCAHRLCTDQEQESGEKWFKIHNGFEVRGMEGWKLERAGGTRNLPPLALSAYRCSGVETTPPMLSSADQPELIAVCQRCQIPLLPPRKNTASRASALRLVFGAD